MRPLRRSLPPLLRPPLVPVLVLLLVSIARGCDPPPSSSSVLSDETSSASERLMGDGGAVKVDDSRLLRDAGEQLSLRRRNFDIVLDPNFCALEFGFPCNRTVGCIVSCNHTCDGRPGTEPVCKACRGVGARCFRASQCCQYERNPLSCQNNFCWPSRFLCPAVPPSFNLTKSIDLSNTVTTSASTCQSRADCCGGSAGSFQLTCDGSSSSTRRCVVCKAARQGPCTRSTQCCQGLTCRSRKCS